MAHDAVVPSTCARQTDGQENLKKSTIETARIQIAYIIQSTKKKETRHTDPFNNSKFLILPAVEFETSSYSLSLCFTNSVEKQREKDGITARGEREMRTVY